MNQKGDIYVYIICSIIYIYSVKQSHNKMIYEIDRQTILIRIYNKISIANQIHLRRPFKMNDLKINRHDCEKE